HLAWAWVTQAEWAKEQRRTTTRRRRMKNWSRCLALTAARSADLCFRCHRQRRKTQMEDIKHRQSERAVNTRCVSRRNDCLVTHPSVEVRICRSVDKVRASVMHSK